MTHIVDTYRACFPRGNVGAILSYVLYLTCVTYVTLCAVLVVTL